MLGIAAPKLSKASQASPNSHQASAIKVTDVNGTCGKPQGSKAVEDDKVDTQNYQYTSGWELDSLNNDKTPIQVDAVQLNEARLVCREAMTNITEEVRSVITRVTDDANPAGCNTRRGASTCVCLVRCRHKEHKNEATRLSMARTFALPAADVEGARVVWRLKRITKVQAHLASKEAYYELLGDDRNPARKYEDFCTLDIVPKRNNGSNIEPGLLLRRLSIQTYYHHTLDWSSFAKSADHAIGAIGFSIWNSQ